MSEEINDYERLTFTGNDDLFRHPIFGARTLEHIKEMEQIKNSLKNIPIKKVCIISISDALYLRDEYCIETHGCSMF